MRDRPGGELEHLIDRLYAAVEDPRHWASYVEALAAATEARIAAIATRNRSTDRAQLVGACGVDQATIDECLAERDTPLCLLGQRSLDTDAVVQDNIAGAHSRLNDRLRRYRPSHAVVVARLLDGNVEGHICLIRTEGDPPFPAAAERLLKKLLPHHYRARALARMIRAGEDAISAARVVLDALGAGVVIFDEGSQPLLANAAAHELFDRRDGLTLGEAGLQALSSADTQVLRAAIAEAAAGAGPLALPIPRRSMGRHYAVLVVPLPGAGGGRFGVRPAAAAVVADPEGGNFLSRDMLEALYGLTPAEARLVTGLAEGKRLDEIAEQTGVSKNTLRTQLNRAFEKTGTNRQAELIRLVLSGAALLRHDKP